MAKLKLTKSELKRQRDQLKQFQRYLPTLQLKKQQLQMRINEARKELEEKESDLGHKEQNVRRWVGLLADPQTEYLRPPVTTPPEEREQPEEEPEPSPAIEQWIVPDKIALETVNIAGANVPFLKGVTFPKAEYDPYDAPFWLDRGIKDLQKYATLLVDAEVLKDRIALLEQEWRVTSQRVNLFEKVKIPESQENIRRIRIYLGDMQANAVGISKVAKKKVSAAGEELEPAMV